MLHLLLAVGVGKAVGLVLNGSNEGKGTAVHVDGNFPPVAVHDGAGAVVVILYHAVQRHICQRCTGKRLLCGAHLSPAAVHQQKVRLLPEPVAAGLTAFSLCSVFFVLCRPAGNGLCQRGIVVRARHGFHFELAVARLEGLAILEGDHAADAAAIAPVGDIVALDGAGRL